MAHYTSSWMLLRRLFPSFPRMAMNCWKDMAVLAMRTKGVLVRFWKYEWRILLLSSQISKCWESLLWDVPLTLHSELEVRVDGGQGDHAETGHPLVD